MAINLHQLTIFHTVARTGSFSRAAAELLISQPSVSIQVGELERQFGVELFEQVGKSVRLTEAGRILDDYAGRILGLIEETRRAVDEVKGLRRGRILIGATPTPGTYLLPVLLGRLKEQYPRLETVLRIAGPRQVQEMILRHDLHAGLIGGRITFPDLTAIPLMADEMVLVVAPGHRFAQLPAVEIADLSGEPFILRERGSGSREVIDDALHRAGVHITPVLELEGAEMVKQAVAADLGVSILSRCAVDLEVASGRLRIVPVRGLRIERAISLVYHKGRRLPRVAQAFIELVTPRPAPPADRTVPAPGAASPPSPTASPSVAGTRPEERP
jgi:DNA-binding transcriptional LysR family regulator